MLDRFQQLSKPRQVAAFVAIAWLTPNTMLGATLSLAQHTNNQDAQIETCSPLDAQVAAPFYPRATDTLVEQANQPVERSAFNRLLNVGRVVLAPLHLAGTFDPIDGIGENTCYGPDNQLLLSAAGRRASNKPVAPPRLLRPTG